MLRGAVGLFLILVFMVPVAADVPLPPWSWNSYTGTNVWQVTVTEDQSGCGGGVYTNQYSVPIQYDNSTAVMGDVGHGPARGTFISGNILHIPGRTVDDPPGTSKLSEYDVFFTTDCTAFAAKYRWDYSGSDGSCSGTTTLNGTNSLGCPAAVPVVPAVPPASGSYLSSDLATARYDLTQDLSSRNERDSTTSLLNAKKIPEDTANRIIAADTATINAKEATIEGQYQAILDKDPANFYANMDMAELKKSQGKLDDYIRYVDAALANTKVAQSTADAIRNDIMAKNNLGEWPTPSNSYVIAMLGPDVRTSAQNVYGRDIKKDATGTSFIDNLRYILTYDGPADLMKTVALPGGGEDAGTR